MSFTDDLTAAMSGTNAAGLSRLSAGQRSALDQNAIGAVSDAGGNILSAISHLQFGMQAQRAAEYQAAQLRQNAGEAMASAQRQAFDVDRQSAYTVSAALASAAASGGGASDPTVVNLIARNAGEFAYRKAVALYQGEDKARLMNMQASAKEYEGKNTMVNSALVGGANVFRAGTTLMQGEARGASMLSRFGGDGPPVRQWGW
jgi:hypothetical protein